MKNREKCQPNLTDPDAYEQQLQQECKGLALRFVEPWLLAFVNPDAKQGRCQPVMVCYALLGKTRGKVSTATALENFRYTNSGRGGVKHPTLQPSSSLFQIEFWFARTLAFRLSCQKLSPTGTVKGIFGRTRSKLQLLQCVQHNTATNSVVSFTKHKNSLRFLT